MSDLPAWKDDFPVSWVDDHFVTRREFTRSLVWVSCASFAATSALTGTAALTRRQGPFRAVRVASVDELPVGGSMVFGYPEPDQPCLLIRRDADTFVAFGQKCTHLGCPVVCLPRSQSDREQRGAPEFTSGAPAPRSQSDREQRGAPEFTSGAPEAQQLHCPCHEGFFSAEDGSVLAGPPPRPLPRIELERRGDELWAVAVRS